MIAIIALIAAIAFAVLVPFLWKDDHKGFSIVSAAIAVILTILLIPFRAPEPGSAYTETLFGNVSDHVLTAEGGPYFPVNPFATYDKWYTRGYAIAIRSENEEGQPNADTRVAFTSDSAPVTVYAIFHGRLNQNYLPWLRRNRGDPQRVEDYVFRPAMQSALRLGTAQFTMDGVLTTEREELALAVQAACNSEVQRLLHELGLSAVQAAEAFQCLAVVIQRIEVPERVQIALTEEAASAPEARALGNQGEGLNALAEAAPSDWSARDIAVVQESRAARDFGTATRERDGPVTVVTGNSDVAVSQRP